MTLPSASVNVLLVVSICAGVFIRFLSSVGSYTPACTIINPSRKITKSPNCPAEP